ncbi:hypothetical protein HPB52_006468 [Rhipicephalus sanguineus]|uniref:Endonuclease/exonuclease/phosphatase domain-containing protein n=1 Tax=Rhipicephalus sanguineus TaxID=34632 RepID=A0A9D4PC57_RHISA|nr:hypothetical protein HPB52_006468 [Rhipicephalus sanguineus]
MDKRKWRRRERDLNAPIERLKNTVDKYKQELQKDKRRLELRQATLRMNAAQQETAPRNDLKPRPPPQRRRGPLPRMPPDTIQVLGRPKTPVDLTKLPPWRLYEALLKAASLPDRLSATNCVFTPQTTLSPSIGERTIEFHVYAPPPDDAFHGIMFNTFDSFTADEILKDLQASNPSMPVVGGRRMGRANHDHPPTPQGTQPTCLARCIVCNGGHATNSSNCKYRIIKKPIPSDNAPKQAHNQEQPPQQPSILRNRSSPSSSTPGPKKLAWAQGPPESLKASPTSSPDTPDRCRLSAVLAAMAARGSICGSHDLDAKFEARFTTLQQGIADTNLLELNALKSYTEATNTSINALKNYTETTTAEIQARLERRQRGPQTRNGLIMARPILTGWQWNCRGYRKKWSHMQQLVQKLQADPQATESAPDVISLQETSTPSTLPGYVAYHQLGSHASPCASTLVHNGLTAVQHEIEATGIQHTLVKIFPRKRTDSSLFILNVYSSPREKAADFSHLFSETIALVGDAQLFLLSDIHARHPDCGYVHTDPKRNKLWWLVQELRLTLLNHPQQPLTHIGNSVCRDTSPDLTLCKNVTCASWDNTGLLAGSDHNILAIAIQTRLRSRNPRLALPSGRNSASCVETTADLSTTDSRPLHLWDAHAGLLRRWRRQRHNKKLRHRIETLAREIEEHSLALARQQWGQLCDGLNGQMSSKRTWHLLRHLLDPCSSKLSAQKQLQRLLHRYLGTDAELLDELALRYVSIASPDAPPEKLLPYSGKPNPKLDEDITKAESTRPC